MATHYNNVIAYDRLLTIMLISIQFIKAIVFANAGQLLLTTICRYTIINYQRVVAVGMVCVFNDCSVG